MACQRHTLDTVDRALHQRVRLQGCGEPEFSDNAYSIELESEQIAALKQSLLKWIRRSAFVFRADCGGSRICASRKDEGGEEHLGGVAEANIEQAADRAAGALRELLGAAADFNRRRQRWPRPIRNIYAVVQSTRWLA